MNIYKYFEKPEDLDGYTLVLTTVPELAYTHAVGLNKRFPEGEKAIASASASASDPNYASRYALNLIKGRFPEGEKAIASDPEYKEKYEEFLNSL